jgi:uncharacterized RDD family membrane protein YckC
MRFFNRITYSTPESVELEFTLAGIGSRAFALLIDYHILFLGWALFITIWSILTGQLLEYFDRIGFNYSGLDNWLAAIIVLLSFAFFVGYFIFFEVFWQGQTPGKRLAKIRVVREDGRPVKLTQAVLRSLLRSIDDLLFVGFFFIILGRKEKRLGDLVAGTIVIQEERPAIRKAFQLSEQAQPIAEKLLQVANISLLLPDDFAVIREYLQRRLWMDKKAKSQISLQLARQVKDVVEIENLPSEMTPDLFLEAIYLAYQQQFGDRE